MESRFLTFLLNLILGVTLILPSTSWSEELDNSQELSSVVQPEIKRIEFIESELETADYEIIGSIGIISIEDFGANTISSIKIGYQISDAYFITAELAQAKGGRTSFETLSGGAPLLSSKEREFNQYLLTAGYNILPGEAFFTEKVTYNTAMYIEGGIGITDFAGDTHFTTSIGLGHRILLGNYYTLYTDIRNNMFRLDVLGEDKLTNNIQLTIGLGIYF